MGFKKGHEVPKEWREKISSANSGKKKPWLSKRNIIHKKGQIPWNKGKKGVQAPWNKGKKLGKNPEHSLRMKKFYRKHPEKHLNRIVLSKKGRGYISAPQRKLFKIIKNRFPDAELEYPIKTKDTIRFADIGIPSLNIDIEYDEEFWHKDKDDSKRDNELKAVGWSTIRITNEEVDMVKLTDENLNKSLIPLLDKVGFLIEGKAKDLCPVDNKIR